MKKIIKIVGITFLLLLITLIALPFVFKDKIEVLVKEAVNENVNAEVNWSEYGLSLFKSFPDMTVTLDSLSIKGKEVFQGVTLADVAEIDVNLDVMSLFGDSATINSISLKKPLINIIVNEEGKANYDIALPSETTSSADESASSSFKLALNEYSIEEGTLNYIDNSSVMIIYLENFNHTGQGDFTESVFKLETETEADELDFVFDGVPYINKVKADLDVNLLMDLEKMRFEIEGNELLLNDLKLVAEGFIEMPDDNIDMDIQYAAPETNIKQLVSMIPEEFTGDISAVSAKGELKLNGYVTGRYNENQLPAIGLDLNVLNGFLQYPDLPESINNILLAASLIMPEGNNMDDMEINISELKMNIAGNPLDAKMFFTAPFTKQYIDAALKTNIDLAKISQAFPMDETTLNGLINADVVFKGNAVDVVNQNFSSFFAQGLVDVKNMEVDASDTYKMKIEKAHFDVTPALINLTEFTGKIGESDLEASGDISNFLGYALNGDKLKGDFNLRSNSINMADFMTTDDVEGEVESEEMEYYVDVPENIEFNLDTDIKKLIYDGTELTNINGAVNVNDGTAALQDVSLNFLGGSILLDGSYSTKDRLKPLLEASYDLANLDIQKVTESFEIISTLAPIAEYCQGKFGSEMSFSSELGKDMFPLYESISANGDVTTNSVQVEKFKPLNEIAEKLNINKLAKQTVNNVNVNFSVEDGKVSVQPYEVKLDGMTTTISGSMGFDQSLDYLVNMDVPFSKLPQQGTDLANDLLSKVNQLGTNFSSGQIIPVTIKITGTMTSPKLSLSGVGTGMVTDIKEEIKEQVTNLVHEKVDEVKEDVSVKLKAEADKLIAEANTQAENVRTEGIKLADKGKEEAYKAAQAIEDEAKKPWEKVAAKLAADKARKKADEIHAKAVLKTNEKADKIISDAQNKADALLEN